MDQLLENHMYATHAIVAAGSVTVGTAVTYPLDTLKTIIQVGSVSGKQLTPTQALERVRSFSGYSGLYSGFSWLAIGRTLGVGARFGVYEILTAFYKDGREDNYVYVNEALIAGIAAGATESILSSPFELMKIRAQVIAASRVPSSISNLEKRVVGSSLRESLLRGYTPNKSALNEYIGLLSTISHKSPNLVGALQDYPWMMTGSGKPPSACDVKRPLDVISLEGWKALWRGFRSGVARDSFFAGIFFSTWQFIHRAMLDWKAVGMDPPPRSDADIGPLSPLGVSVAAGVSAMFGAAGSHWFDTAKTRSQCSVVPKYVAMERKVLKWGIPGNRFERYTGLHPADRSLLLRGIWLRTARSGMASFLIVGSYFLSVNHLISSN